MMRNQSKKILASGRFRENFSKHALMFVHLPHNFVINTNHLMEMEYVLIAPLPQNDFRSLGLQTFFW